MGVFNHRSGSRERGQAWKNVSTNLNVIEGIDVTLRAVRDRFTHLAKKQKVKNSDEVKASGLGGEELTEFDILIEDLISLSEDSDARQELESENKKAANEKEIQKAKDIRQTAMERLSET